MSNSLRLPLASLCRYGMRSISAAMTCVILAVPATHAARIQVSGHVTSVQFGLAGTFSAGQPYSLYFDWVGPGLANTAGAFVHIYPNAGSSFSLQIGTYQITSEKAGYVLANGPTMDNFNFGAAQRWATTIPGSALTGSYLIGDRFPYWAVVALQDSTATALTNSLLSSPIQDFSAYAHREFVLRFATQVTPDVAFGVQSVFGTVDTIAVVPEPSNLILCLFGFSILSLALARRSGRSRDEAANAT